MNDQGDFFKRYPALPFPEHKMRDTAHRCPTCTQKAVLYPRVIGRKQAIFLGWLVSEVESQGPEWVRYDKAPLPLGQFGGAYGKLKHWKLIQHKLNMENKYKGPGNSGLWLPTPRGAKFVHGLVTVPKIALVFHDQCYGYEGDPVWIWEAARLKRFNWQSMMRGEQDWTRD